MRQGTCHWRQAHVAVRAMRHVALGSVWHATCGVWHVRSCTCHWRHMPLEAGTHLALRRLDHRIRFNQIKSDSKTPTWRQQGAMRHPELCRWGAGRDRGCHP
eukprot:1159810-Pelagomonas_calceolata.AAC.15